jgi:GTP cyclohydrolase II
MEAELLAIERRAAALKGLPFYLRDEGRIEALRAEYKELHGRWMQAKAQMSLDV